MTGVPRVPTGVPQRAAAPHPTNAAANQWVSLGPAVAVAASAGRPRVTGRFRALALSPDSQRIYAGSAQGGVWYSGDAGVHWTALDHFASTRDSAGQLHHADALTVGAIAVRWGATAAADVVYVGPGERAGIIAGSGIRVATGPVTTVEATGAAAADPWRFEAAELAGVAVSRLVPDPVGAGVVWAATTKGLYRRTAAGVWEKVNPAPASGLGTGEITDVLVAAPRVYAASATGKLAYTADGVTWLPIPLPVIGTPGTGVALRLRLAAGAPSTTPANGRLVYVLADGPRLWRVDGATAEAVTGLPAAAFGASPGSPLPPGLAIAAHPDADAAHRDMLVIGGQTVEHEPGRWEAALFAGTLLATDGHWSFPAELEPLLRPAKWLGAGIPGGIQAIVWNTGGQLWTAGDGGLFRSTTGDTPGAFAERNTGLDTIEPVALAQSGEVLLVGTATNGVLRRDSAEAWHAVAEGSGGVAADPDNALFEYAQRGRGRWQRSTDGGRTWAELPYLTAPEGRGTPEWVAVRKSAQDGERKTAAPVSSPAIFADSDTAHGTQLALGTDRIWYTDAALDGAGLRHSVWVTLPTATDPYGVGGADDQVRRQDQLDGPVLSVRWGGATRLYALTGTSVSLFDREATGAWKPRAVLYDRVAAHRNWKGKLPSGAIPPELPLLSLAVHQPGIGKGTLYAGTGGPPGSQCLWWFNGNSSWVSTGLTLDSPVYAVAVDRQHPEIVYAGTDAGVWKGTKAAGATWTWIALRDGLPEASCVDLLVSADGRLLRAALTGRGVWELPLDGAVHGREVFLRAHPYDTRRSTVDIGGPRDPYGNPVSGAHSQVRLDASPDIRVVRRPGSLDIPEPVRLPLDADADPYDIWRIASALRLAGERVDPDDGWSPALVAGLNRRRAGPPARTDEQVWDDLVAGNRLPYQLTPPDHADLALRLRDEPDRWPKDTRASCASGSDTQVHVTVHSRHWSPLAAATVHVALLRAPYGRGPGLAGVAPLPATWVAELRAGATAPAPAPSAWLGLSPWSYADPAHPFQPLPASLDPRHPQVVTFDVDLTGSSWDTPGWLLLAVVVTDADPLGGADVDVATVVRGNRLVAARSVRNARSFAEPTTGYPGTDMSAYRMAATMSAVWQRSNVYWTGMYLDAPKRFVGELPVPLGPGGVAKATGHHRVGTAAPVPANSWINAWPQLYPAWGLLPIYFGQQDPANEFGPNDLRDVAARENGADAARKAVQFNVPPGAVIYVDYEMNGIIPAGLTYLETLYRRMAELGYRPGLYAFEGTSMSVRPRVPGLFVWNVKFAHAVLPPGAPAGAPVPAIWRVRRGQLILDSSFPVGTGDPDALARQYQHAINLVRPVVGPAPVAPAVVGLPGPAAAAALRAFANAQAAHRLALRQQAEFDAERALRDETGAVVPGPLPAWDYDLDLAVVQHPAFPEWRNAPQLIRGGRVVVTGAPAARSAIYAIRRGRPKQTIWTGPGVRPNTHLTPADLPHLWNPFAVPAAVRIPGATDDADRTDLLLGLGYTASDGDGVWRVQALRKAPGRPWRHDTVPDAGLTIDPLGGVTATTRSDRTVDAFVVDNATGRVAGGRWDEVARTWSTLDLLRAGAGFATPEVRRTNRPAAVSRAAGLLDLFTVDSTGQLWVTHSPAPGVWQAPVQIGGPALRVHPLANVVAVSCGDDRIDVLFIGRTAAVADTPATADPAPTVVGPPDPTPPAVWDLYTVPWTAAANWGAPAAVIPMPVPVGPAPRVQPDPLVPIAAGSRDEDRVNVFTTGVGNGRVYGAEFTGAWSALAVVLDPAPRRVTSLDGVSSTGTDDVELVLSIHDGSVYATHWDAATPVYTALENMGLDPV